VIVDVSPFGNVTTESERARVATIGSTMVEPLSRSVLEPSVMVTMVLAVKDGDAPGGSAVDDAVGRAFLVKAVGCGCGGLGVVLGAPDSNFGVAMTACLAVIAVLFPFTLVDLSL
jgi:hypothetical protein